MRMEYVIKVNSNVANDTGKQTIFMLDFKLFMVTKNN